MKKFILIDALNMAFRAKHVVHNQDIETKIGLAFHIMLASINKVSRRFGADHVVACFDARSWRKDVSDTYKLNRKLLQSAKTVAEQEDDKLFMDAIFNFKTYLEEKTNVTVLYGDGLEADDHISFWIREHQNDEHIIVSSDSDFYQLIAENVKIYDGIKDEFITLEGFFNDKGKPVIDKKTKKPKTPPDPEWLLFHKCIRGDSSDNIFPSYPGAREKGSKNRIGMREAFEDRNTRGYNWNNFMLTRWVDENNVEHRVADRYEQNRLLIDLNMQPEEIVNKGKKAITEAAARDRVNNVGAHFLKFCALWDLRKISEYPDEYANILNKPYPGKTNE